MLHCSSTLRASASAPTPACDARSVWDLTTSIAASCATSTARACAVTAMRAYRARAASDDQRSITMICSGVAPAARSAHAR
eukprot:4095647-Pleurochrysis_carterae.AAC.1